MKLQTYLIDHFLIADGAIGTYYNEITGVNTGFSELANLEHPEIIRQIHREYIQAGARLIRTNTFSANSFTLNLAREQVAQLVVQGYALAREAAAGHPVFIAANLGPVPESSLANLPDPAVVLAEYHWIVDHFLAAGAEIFNFETFSSLDYLPEICGYIKAKQPHSFILTQFTVNPDGFTRKGVSVSRLINQVKQIRAIDAYGFNCGAGPTHLYRLLQKFDFSEDLVAVLPNAGFPEIVNERTLYIQNPSYFAERIKRLHTLGVKIFGGCCGTTPAHIRAIAHQDLTTTGPADLRSAHPALSPRKPVQMPSRFSDQLQNGKFIIAVELDPPFDAATAKLMDRAKIYKNAGVDLITIADSPLAKPRADSVAIAAKIQRELGVETLPHLCCRDRNINGLKSAILAAHIEGLRNILAVTGDPLPHATQNEIKSVFNLNSTELMGLLAEMNRTAFNAAPFTIGGALNLNVRNKPRELKRMLKKVDQGARFFLTQPIFNQEVIDFLPQLTKPAGVKIIGGILPIVTYANALFLKNEVPGMSIDAELVARFHPDMDRETAEQAGIELAVEIATRIRSQVDGFYIITPFNRANMVVEILKRLELINL